MDIVTIIYKVINRHQDKKSIFLAENNINITSHSIL